MQKQKTEITLPVVAAAAIIFLIIMSITFGLKDKHHKETIEIYEEYYVLDEQMDILHRQWATYYQHYSEEEYYLKFRTEKYLRYLELKKIIGELTK